MGYGTAGITTETCDWANKMKSLPFIGTIFYLNQFTQNITYLITHFNIHMPIAEGIDIAQRWKCMYVKIECRKQRMMQKVFWIQEIFDHLIKRISFMEVSWKSINTELFIKTCSFEIYIGLLPLISIIWSKESGIEVLWKSFIMELRYLTKHAVLKLV